MCSCNKKKGLSEILFIAQKFAITQKIIIIVYEKNGKIDFCDESWFNLTEKTGATGILKVDENGECEKI